MAEVLYFNSPRMPLSFKHVSSLRNKVEPSGRRRIARMEVFSERARMARIREPTFCPSNIDSLLVQATTPLNDKYESLRLPGSNRESDGDLGENRENDGLTIDQRSSPESDLISTSHKSIPNHNPQISPVSTISHQPHHPRPESRERFEQEDGRRVRFALPIPNEDGAVHTRLSRVTGADGKSVTVIDDVELRQVSELDATQVEQTSTNTEQTTASPQLRLPTILNYTFDASASNNNYASRFSYGGAMNHNPLAVDYPNRFYDFATFMDDWRGQRDTPDKPPIFMSGVGRPSGPIPSEVDQNQVRDKIMDMQGIRWERFGPDRTDALRARSLLRPSRGSAARLQSQVEPETPDWSLERTPLQLPSLCTQTFGKH